MYRPIPWYVEWGLCLGDYAVMLSIHAKMKHWDMGVVAVLGYDSNGKELDHAFNAIRCKEGLLSTLNLRTTMCSMGLYVRAPGTSIQVSAKFT